MKRKLLLIIPTLRNGGAERVISILANEAVKRSYEVTLLLVLSGDVCYELNSSVRVVVLPKIQKNRKGIPAGLNRILGMRSIIKKISPDLIVSFMTTMNMYAVLSSIGLGIPVVGSERNAPGMERNSPLRSLLTIICYHLIDGMIFQTGDAKAFFNHINFKSTAVIANPVTKGLPQWDDSFKSRKCVAVGRLERQKNYTLLLDAFYLFHIEHPDYSLEIYGDGSCRAELEDVVRQKGLTECVSFMGVRRDVHTMIKDAEMFVMTSDFEGIPNALLESLSMGIPSVATDCPCGGVRLLIRNEENGYLVPVGDAKAIHSRMCEIVEKPQKSKMLSQQAAQDMLMYTEESICEQYFSYFERIIKYSQEKVL